MRQSAQNKAGMVKASCTKVGATSQLILLISVEIRSTPLSILTILAPVFSRSW